MRVTYLIQVQIYLLLIICSACESAETDKAKTDKINQEPQTKISTKYSKDFLLGKFDYRTHSDFVLVSEKWSDKEIYLQKDTYLAFEKMANAAAKDGIPLVILSGTRNFSEQKVIWDRKWKNLKTTTKDEIGITLKILSSSSMPSTSRHHWGTDFDVNSVEDSYFLSGMGKRVYSWLSSNANNYGFCQVYDNKKDTKRTGYEVEKWHWSYMPISTLILDAYINQIQYKDINGFQGDELAANSRVKIIENFILGISKSCRK
jgi:LAS superfamily LD-carboxypeptidase LdcB